MPQIIAHRGASGEELENSLAAFRLAVAQGADGIELDVHGTSDGGFVVHHDASVRGVPIAQHRTADLRALSLTNGETLPTLADALGAIGASTDVWIEIKSAPATHLLMVLDVLAAGPAPARYHVHAFDHRLIARLTAAAPELEAGVLSSSYPIDPVAPVRAAGAGTLWQEWSLIDAALVATVHGAGLHLVAWTIDDPDRLRAVAAMGVDAVCTNHPFSAREVLT